jgi:hypothetical protein
MGVKDAVHAARKGARSFMGWVGGRRKNASTDGIQTVEHFKFK